MDFLVKGRVTTRAGKPAHGLNVEILDRDLRGSTLLGEALTDEYGNYEITYESRDIGDEEPPRPDLEFRVYTRARRQLPITFEAAGLVEVDDQYILFNAGDEEEVDITLRVDSVEPSMHEEIIDDIARHLDGVEIIGLTPRDIEFLHHDTGRARHEIAFVVADAQLRDRVGVPEAVLFALGLRGIGAVGLDDSGVPSMDLSALLDHPLEAIVAAVEEAIDAGDIPGDLRSQIDAIRTRFSTLKETHQGESPVSRRERVNRLGRIAGLDKESASRLTDLLSDITPTDEAWLRLGEDGVVDDGQIADVRLTFELDSLTRHNTDLVELLKTGDLPRIGEEIRSPRDLVALDANDWTAVLDQEQIEPPHGQDRETYARMLAWEVERRHPTDVFVDRTIRTDRSFLSDRIERIRPLLDTNEQLFTDLASRKGALPSDADDDMRELVALANRYSDLGVPEVLDRTDLSASEKADDIEQRIGTLETFFEINPELDLRHADLVGLTHPINGADSGNGRLPIYEDIEESVRSRVRHQVMAYQRVMALAPNADVATRLLDAGFSSAHAIASVPLSSFAASVEVPLATAMAIHSQALVEADRASFIAGSLVPLLPGILVGTNVDNIDENLVNRLRELDSYEELFGSQTGCDCAHCHSVFGPLAYFVDLMVFVETNFLEPTFGEDTSHPIHLRTRRPDLWDQLELSCKNATDTIPYLDIVNQVLANYVGRVEQLQPTGDESIEDAVFALFSGGDRSFQQPVHLPFEEIRAGLDRLGVSLPDAMETARGDDQAIVRAWLGLSQEEILAITRSIAGDTGAIRRRYGLDDRVDMTALTTEDVMAATGLTRAELGRLTELHFVDAGGAGLRIDLVREEGAIQPSHEELHGLNADRLDRIFRFVRLWGALPWTLEELDHVISVLERRGIASGIDFAALEGITNFLRLQDALDLSVAQVCALIDEIPTRRLQVDEPSLYDQLFNKDVFVDRGGSFDPGDPPSFHHPHFDMPPTVSEGTDPALPRLLSGLDVSEGTFVDLMSYLRGLLNPVGLIPDGGGQPRMHVELDLHNLTLLYRHALIVDRLHRSVDELIQALDLTQTQVPPFLAGETEVLALLEFLEWVQDAGLTIGDVVFGVGDEPEDWDRTFDSKTIREMLPAAEARVTFSADVFGEIPGLEAAHLSMLVQELLDADLIESSVVADAFRLTDAYEPTAMPQLSDELLELQRDAVVRILNGFIPEVHAGELLGEKLNVTSSQLSAINAIVTGSTSDRDRALHRTQGLQLTSTETAESDVQEFLARTEELAFITTGLGLGDETLELVARHGTLFGIRVGDPNPVSVESLRRLSRYQALLSRYDSGAAELAALVTDHDLTEDFSQLDDSAKQRLTDEFAALTGVSPELARSLLDQIPMPREPIEAAGVLVEALELAQKLRTGGTGLARLRSPAFEDLRGARDTVYSALHAKYTDADKRKAALEPIEEQLRDLKRDRLASHILARPELQFEDTTDLYHYFLLDPEMDGCALTSPVVAATGSLQLYVQRCLMHLEQTEDGEVRVRTKEAEREKIKAEWEWRKNYRVWEANRKVFLYPENYLEPDLRDNKTPPFRELEDRLMQEELNEEAAERLYRGYLDRYAEVGNLSIAGSFFEPFSEASTEGTVYIIGRTRSQPARFYVRTQEGGQWSFWERIELEINAKEISPIVYLGRLFLFWVEAATKPHHTSDGEFDGYHHAITLKFASQTAEGSWTAPQEVDLPPALEFVEDLIERAFSPVDSSESVWKPRLQRTAEPKHPSPRESYMLDSPAYNRIFPFLYKDRIHFRYGHSSQDYRLDVQERRAVAAQVDEFSLESVWVRSIGFVIPDYDWLWYPEDRLDRDVDVYLGTERPIPQPLYHESITSWHFFGPVGDYVGTVPFGSSVEAVNNASNLWILERKDGATALVRQSDDTLSVDLLRTAIPDRLRSRLFRTDLWLTLSPYTQMVLGENTLFESPSDEMISPQTHDAFSHDHPFRTYNWEVFFHVPLLIANALNSQGKYEAAERWYNVVFDPTGVEIPLYLQHPNDANWPFLALHGLDPPTLEEVLTSTNEAYRAYRRDPFNPHAIARLRPTAYQRRVVMKYVDNLIDWGDDLFARDTRESINEAALLYTTAADILGSRPRQLGVCEKPPSGLTYMSLEADDGFIVTIENLDQTLFAGRPMSLTLEGVGGADSTSATTPLGRDRLAESAVTVSDGWMPAYEDISDFTIRGVVPVTTMIGTPVLSFAEGSATASGEDIRSSISGLVGRLVPFTPDAPAFCVSQNKDMLKHWDRVEDRLYKIRHCMNLEGVRRALTLFEPPIDPALLVRARAAGLTLDDVLGGLGGELPPYRFNYLIGKAKEYVSTLRGLGGALLAALEKRDAEELAQLRSVHQQNIQRMTKRIRQQQVEVARESVRSLTDQRDRVEARLDHLGGKIDQGWNTWEVTSFGLSSAALASHITAAIVAALAPPAKMVPDIEVGYASLGGFSTVKYGSEQTGGSVLAAAQVLRDVTTGLNMGAGIASTLASYDRRREEWEHQRDLAQMELDQIERDILASEIRVAIAERELEVHEKQIEQVEEVYEFYKNRFSNLGLYTWLASEAKGLYRQAYRMALDMARMAEASYRYERDDTTIFIDASVWDAEHAGLLAGEKLMLQLQQMEKSYLESNQRNYEVNQTFSLAQLDPTALHQLREKGSCEFFVAEPFFDVAYPGQFRRRIKSVRLTIPCVTGPYVNVNAKLTLLQASVRQDPHSDLIAEPRSRNVSIATSQAQNDGGVFELSFRDERYVPFEGAGAVSEWKLELPGTFRAFDYDTISDVLVHISYTAKEDGAFRERVEQELREALNSVAEDTGISRGLSLGQEFATEFHSLFRPHATDQQTVTVKLGHRHFPYFLHNERLKVERAILGMQLRERWAPHFTNDDEISASLRISVDDQEHTQQGTLTKQSGIEAFDGKVPHASYDLSGANAEIGLSPIAAHIELPTAQLIDLYTSLHSEAGIPLDGAEPTPENLREIIEDIYLVLTVKLEGPLAPDNT